MSLFINRYEHPLRRIVDRFPYTVRRGILLGIRPGTGEILRAMRTDESPMGCSAYVQHRCIYIHVPKTGGTSIKKLLCPGKHPSHTTLHYFSLLFSAEEFRAYFKFAFVRNPWDRLHSAYRFLRQGGKGPSDRYFNRDHLAVHETFEDFVMRGIDRPEIISYVHMIPQERFLVTRHRKLQLDFIGYYESLQEDFRHAAKRLGLPSDLPWENKTEGGDADYRAAYTGPMIDKVARVYRDDVELFGYSFDGVKPISLNRKD